MNQADKSDKSHTTLEQTDYEVENVINLFSHYTQFGRIPERSKHHIIM
jgi:hypothetical protein